MRRTRIAFLLAAFAVLAVPTQAQVDTWEWEVPLQNGWNLIAIPLQPIDPSVDAVLEELIPQGAFKTLWSYDATTGQWSAFVADGAVPGLPAITQFETGRGYWLEVNGAATLTIKAADPLVPVSSLSRLESGWNLISTSADEAKPYDRIFDGVVTVEEIWTFESGAFKGVVLGSPGTEPLREDFTEMQPDQGYWVWSAGTVAFGPDLDTSLAGDVDVMPLLPPPVPGTRIPWPTLTAGDEDIGLDGFYDSPLTQRALTFRDTIDVQLLTLLNSGSGVLSYTATIDDACTLCGSVPKAALPWLNFREEDPDSRQLTVRQTVSGSLATESATLTLWANRTELRPGLYCAGINIATNSVSGECDDTTRTLVAYIEIPPIEGDYEIDVEIDTINGSPADTHGPRFHVSLYGDASGQRAIIDAERTLLLPQSLRMVGDVYQDDTNRFTLSGSYTLPAADYADPEADDANPYDVDLQRDITFVARRRERVDPAGSGLGPLDLVGEYGETIRGPLGADNPIHLAGTFRGRRVAPEPSVLDGEFPPSMPPDQDIPDGGTAEFTFDVTNRLLIAEVAATLELTHPIPAHLWVRLEPPPALGLGELTLRRGSNRPLGTISFEETEPAVEDLQVLSGKIATGIWTLRVEDEVPNDGQSGQVTGAGLDVSGTRVVSISGTVADVDAVPIAGAIVSLTGCGQTLLMSGMTTADGSYQFDDLTDCAYQITVQADGFESTSVSVLIGPDDPDQVVDITPNVGSTIADTNVSLPSCPGGTCFVQGFRSLSTVAGAGARLPRPEPMYVMDAGTFDLDRPPTGTTGLEDTVLFFDWENMTTMTNDCNQGSGSTCVEPGDGDVDPPIGDNSMRAFVAIGGPVIGTSVSGSMRLSIGANP